MELKEKEYWEKHYLATEEVVTEMPEGWKVLKNASTAVDGYIWICNGHALASGKCKLKLLKLNCIKKKRKEHTQLKLF